MLFVDSVPFEFKNIILAMNTAKRRRITGDEKSLLDQCVYVSICYLPPFPICLSTLASQLSS